MYRVVCVYCVFLMGLLIATTAWAGSFDRFLYVEVGSGFCSTPHGTAHLPDAGFDAELDLYLFAGGNYALYYAEKTPPCNSSVCHQDVAREFFKEGRWSASGDKLTLSGFGSATVSGNALSVNITDNRASAGARNKPIKISYKGTSVVAYTLNAKMKQKGYKSTLSEVRDAVYPD
jgi:hypothetical protein